jgi:DNA polymerase-3 subunit delta'
VSWQRVRGHESLVQSFARVVKRGRLAHAYLFTGPPGVGKRLFAEELAKALLCENPPAGRFAACDDCPACHQVAAGTHPDFFTAGRPEDKVELPIEVIRELCQRFSMKSARGRGKVAILDDADDLNDHAANCFLKTLEEPPPRSVLLLVGTNPDRQLATILSRCQVVQFAPLPDPIISDLLRDQGLADAALIDRLVRMSGGSLGRAQALAEPSLWDFRRTFLKGIVKSPADTVGLAQAFMRFVEEAGKESAAQRRRAGLVLGLLTDFLNAVLARSVGATPRLAEQGDLQVLEELVKRLDTEQILALLDRCLEGEMHIDRKVQLVLVLEALVDGLGQRLRSAG